MYSAILLGYKIDTLLDGKTYRELTMRGFNVIENQEDVETYIGILLSSNKAHGAMEVFVDFNKMHEYKNKLLAAVANTPVMAAHAKQKDVEMQIYHIVLED